MRGRQWYALLDNASIHKTKKVKEFAKREGIPLVYNTPKPRVKNLLIN